MKVALGLPPVSERSKVERMQSILAQTFGPAFSVQSDSDAGKQNTLDSGIAASGGDIQASDPGGGVDCSFELAAISPTFQSKMDGTAVAGDARFAEAGGSFDWNVTFANIKLLIEARESAEKLLFAAEERAKRAETRAAEAEHWLRRLHQAVLNGLPRTEGPAAAGSTAGSAQPRG